MDDLFGLLVGMGRDREGFEGGGDGLGLADHGQVRPCGGEVAILEVEVAGFAGGGDVGLFDLFPQVRGDVAELRGAGEGEFEFVLSLEHPDVEQAVVVALFAEEGPPDG